MTLGSIYNVFLNGRPSGLPVDIIDQLVQVKQYEVLTPIQQDIQEAQDRRDIYSNLNSTLVDLYEAASDLALSSTFNTTTATSSNTDVADVEVSGSPSQSTYSLEVTQLAKAHHLIVGVDDGDPSNGVTQGIANAQDASLIADGVTISFYHNGVEYTYTTDENTTLQSLAYEINSDNNGVIAEVLNIGTSDSPQYVLSLKSEDTGSGTSQITQDSSGTTAGINLSASLFEGVNTEQQTTQAGQDAQFSIDGISFTRSSNVVDDVIDGLTITLKSAGSSEISVDIDIDSIVNEVSNLVSKYNNFISFMDQNARYDLENKQAGPLLGDSIARTAENRIRAIFSEPVSGTESLPYQYLSQIGIQFNDDGTLTFDESTFRAALQENRSAVETLFVGENGVAGKLKTFLESYTQGNGVIPSVLDSIDQQIQDLQEKYQEAQDDIEDYREQLVRIYSELENKMIYYQSIQEQLDNLIETWRNTFNSK